MDNIKSDILESKQSFLLYFFDFLESEPEKCLIHIVSEQNC